MQAPSKAISFFVVDPGDLEILVQAVPGAGFIGVQLRALGDARLDEVCGVAFALEDCRDRIAAALANDDDALALAVLVFARRRSRRFSLRFAGFT